MSFVFLKVNGLQEKGDVWVRLMWFLLKANLKPFSDTKIRSLETCYVEMLDIALQTSSQTERTRFVLVAAFTWWFLAKELCKMNFTN